MAGMSTRDHTTPPGPAGRDAAELLQRYTAGDDESLANLLPLVYDELKALASRQLAGQRHNHTLQPTALIHEAYLRLADQDDPDWEDRRHFLMMASTVMRHVLVDYARRRSAAKRPPAGQRVDIETAELGGDFGHDLIALDEVLEQLAGIDPRQARIVELRYFAGLSLEETATTLELSKSTVIREWRMARAWLEQRLGNL